MLVWILDTIGSVVLVERGHTIERGHKSMHRQLRGGNNKHTLRERGRGRWRGGEGWLSRKTLDEPRSFVIVALVQ